MNLFVEWVRNIAKDIHDNAVEKGFYSEFVPHHWINSHESSPRAIEQVATRLALIHSEVSEALEELRSPDFDFSFLYRKSETGKPEGFASELADIVIRVFDLSQALGIDIGQVIIDKHTYNKTRPLKHGGKQF